MARMSGWTSTATARPLQVKEILEHCVVTQVPQTPPCIRGVINLRGNVVPVVDLAAKFGLPPSPVTKRTCMIIVETGVEERRRVMGVLADAVRQVMDLAPDDIEPAPSLGTRIRVDYLEGMGKVGKKFVLLLDVDRVLSSAELKAARAVAAAAASVEPAARP